LRDRSVHQMAGVIIDLIKHERINPDVGVIVVDDASRAPNNSVVTH
jgi:hypothetical protein